MDEQTILRNEQTRLNEPREWDKVIKVFGELIEQVKQIIEKVMKQIETNNIFNDEKAYIALITKSIENLNNIKDNYVENAEKKILVENKNDENDTELMQNIWDVIGTKPQTGGKKRRTKRSKAPTSKRTRAKKCTKKAVKKSTKKMRS